MGDPRKARKKYRTPSHPWRKERLEEENKLAIEYGLKNKEEIWKMDSLLSNITNQSKKLVTLISGQAEKEKLNLIKKLKSLGLLKENQGFEDILNLNIKNIMERRLQTLVHRKGLAKTMKQSRQFITHYHIMVGNKRITSPAYLVKVEEESKISFTGKSALASVDHPERVIQEKAPVKKKAEKKGDKKKEKPKKGAKSEKKEEKPKKEAKEEKKEAKKEKKKEEKPKEEKK